MAKPITLPFKDFLIKIGDGGAPETFAAPCGLNSRGIEHSKELNDSTVPDCDDPDAAAHVERTVVSLSSAIAGEGLLAMEALDLWWEFYESTDSRNIEVALDVPAASHGGKWTGKFHLATFNVTANLGEKVGVTVSMQSDGAVIWVPAA